MHWWQIRYTQSNLNAHGNLFRFNCATETNEEAWWSGRSSPPGLVRHGQHFGRFCMVQSRGNLVLRTCSAQRRPWGVRTACPGHGTEDARDTLQRISSSTAELISSGLLPNLSWLMRSWGDGASLHPSWPYTKLWAVATLIPSTRMVLSLSSRFF